MGVDNNRETEMNNRISSAIFSGLLLVVSFLVLSWVLPDLRPYKVGAIIVVLWSVTYAAASQANADDQ